MASSETRKNRRRRKRELARFAERQREEARGAATGQIAEIARKMRTHRALSPVVVDVGSAMAETVGVEATTGRMMAASMMGAIAHLAGPLTVEIEGEEPVVVTGDDTDLLLAEAVHDMGCAFLAKARGRAPVPERKSESLRDFLARQRVAAKAARRDPAK